MCTVTFIPSKHTIFLTSNRDEKIGRSLAVPPVVYRGVTGKMLFPKDGDAGGTWIASHENGNAVVFLNGGFIAHIPDPPYKKSRGLILLDLLDSESPINEFESFDLNRIEPLTAIIYSGNKLYECRWDGEEKYIKQLDETSPHIWSSVTLYNHDVIEKRQKWFVEWMQVNNSPQQKEILDFHQFTGDGDDHNDLCMNRGQVYTVSVTSLALNSDAASMQYLDLKNQKSYQKELVFEKTIAGR